MASFVQNLISAALPSTVATIEVRSAFSPPYTINVADLAKQGGGPPPSQPGVGGRAKASLLQVAKPTVILSGGAVGKQTIAPWGAASPDEWKKPWLALGALLVITHMAAFAAGRKSKR